MAAGELLVRVDGRAGVGAGHLNRGLVLAGSWRARGGRAQLITEAADDLWRARAAAAGVELVELGSGQAALPPAGLVDGSAAWVVLDGYSYGAAVQQAWRSRAEHLLVVDDHASIGSYREADLVLDQNLGAAALYRTAGEPPGAILAGLRYLLLRPDLARGHAEGVRRPSLGPGPTQVGLVAGGAPVGEVRRWFDQLASALVEAGLAVRWVEGEPDLAAALADSVVVVSAAGSTTWELAALGRPAVVVAVAPNQEAVARAAAAAGVAVAAPRDAARVADLVQSLIHDEPRRLALSAAGFRLIDGHGPTRVVTHLRAADLDLRPATRADAELLWDWANDPAVRAAGAHPAPIGWDEHLAWLDRRLAAIDGRIYLAFDADGPVGEVRFAPVASAAASGPASGPATTEVGVLVAPERRGQFLAPPLIDAGVRRALSELDVDLVVARVRPENTASRRAFVAADFDLDEPVADHSGPVEWLRYTRTRDGEDRRSS